jgi:hypothetical protein
MATRANSDRPIPIAPWITVLQVERHHRDTRTPPRRGVFREGAIAAAYFFLNTWGVGGIAASQELARSVGPRDHDPRETAYLAIDIVLDGLLACDGLASGEQSMAP